MKNKTDAELMKLTQQKHRPALEEIYDRYARLIYSFALKSLHSEQEAKEVVQMVFMRLWTITSVYDKSKGKFRNWLMTLTRNITVDYIRKNRKQKQHIQLEPEEWQQIPGCNDDPWEHVSHTVVKSMIQKAYHHLNDEQKELLRLIYWEGYTLREASEYINKPLGTVKSRLHQTLKVLRLNLRYEKERLL